MQTTAPKLMRIISCVIDIRYVSSNLEEIGYNPSIGSTVKKKIMNSNFGGKRLALGHYYFIFYLFNALFFTYKNTILLYIITFLLF